MLSSLHQAHVLESFVSKSSQDEHHQGSFGAAGDGITGGYTGDALSMKIIIGCLLGLALYNSIELIVMILVTFNKYNGLYFWSLIVSTVGVVVYALGFLIKYFHLLDPNTNICFVAVTMVIVGWYMMVTGQSVVLWSRLHLLTNSRRALRYAMAMICVDAVVLGVPMTILAYGSNANNWTPRSLSRFVEGYNIMEKIQVTGFAIQEVILSAIYIKETMRILKLFRNAQTLTRNIIGSDVDPKNPFTRKIICQLLTINIIIIVMDLIIIALELADLYILQTTLKGVVYSVKLKLEFAVLSKLIQIVRTRQSSSNQLSSERQGTVSGSEAEKPATGLTRCTSGKAGSPCPQDSNTTELARIPTFPDFVDPNKIEADYTYAPTRRARARAGITQNSNPEEAITIQPDSWEVESARRTRWYNRLKNSWIDHEMDKHNIG